MQFEWIYWTKLHPACARSNCVREQNFHGQKKVVLLQCSPFRSCSYRIMLSTVCTLAILTGHSSSGTSLVCFLKRYASTTSSWSSGILFYSGSPFHPNMVHILNYMCIVPASAVLSSWAYPALGRIFVVHVSLCLFNTATGLRLESQLLYCINVLFFIVPRWQISLKVLSYLPPLDLLSCTQVCQYWKALCNDTMWVGLRLSFLVSMHGLIQCL